jgi:hypothetical protein
MMIVFEICFVMVMRKWGWRCLYADGYGIVLYKAFVGYMDLSAESKL